MVLSRISLFQPGKMIETSIVYLLQDDIYIYKYIYISHYYLIIYTYVHIFIHIFIYPIIYLYIHMYISHYLSSKNLFHSSRFNPRISACDLVGSRQTKDLRVSS